MSQQQTRRTFLGTAAAATTLAATGQVSASSTDRSAIAFTEDFADSERDWFLGSDLRGSYAGDWGISLTRPRALRTPAVRYVADGRYSTGIAWAYTPIEIEPGTSLEGEVSAQAWSPAECEHPYTRLQMAVTPDEPTSADDFPDPTQSWFYSSRVGGLNESLWGSAGWNSYSFNWQSTTYDTDTLYLAVGVSTVAPAKFVHFLNGVDVDLTVRDGSADPTPVLEGVELQRADLSEVPTGEPEATYDADNGTVTITGDMTTPTPCHEPVVLNSYYNAEEDELDLYLGSSDTSSPDDYCTQQLDRKGYRAVASFEQTIPSSVSVREGDGTYTLEL